MLADCPVGGCFVFYLPDISRQTYNSSDITTCCPTRALRRVLGKTFVMVLSCHSNDVDVLILDCAFGGFPLHLPIRL